MKSNEHCDDPAFEDDPRVVALIEAARGAEREKCLRIVEAEVSKALSDERAQMNRAKSEGRETAELFFGHGAWAFDELGTAIYHAINGAGMEDPIADETERCAKICEELAAQMRRMADQSRTSRGDLNNSAAAVFDAQETAAGICARRIRGGG